MKKLAKTGILLSLVMVAGFLIPERTVIPVAGASSKDWNENSFWFEPWGRSGVHKGIDIFGKLGTDILSTTDGIVVFTGEIQNGGKVIVILGPKWHFHYFAHLNSINTSALSLVKSGARIGTLGDSGNAKGKPPHLHYAIVRLIPVPWKIDGTTQGYKKAFYINPDLYLGRF
jgi:murein DD-endopeptidase MepM/ murein hydrolase activator NlpD